MEMNIADNVTRVNDTRHLLDPFPRSVVITYVVVLILESLVIITGNAIVLAAFAGTKKLREKKCYWFCVNVAVADLLVGVIAAPWTAYELSRSSGLLMNVPLTSITNFLLSSSFISLAIISLERMYAILWPLKHRVLGARNYYVMIGLSWTLPLLSPIPLYLYNLISFRTLFYLWLPFDCFFSLIIVISYVSIWIKLIFFKNPQHNATTAQDRKLTMSLFLVTAASMMTIMPAILTSIYYFHFRGVKSRYHHVHNSVHVLLMANSLVNPIIYAFRIPPLRHAALRLLCRRTNEIQKPAIATRNRAEVIKQQACAEPNVAANE